MKLSYLLSLFIASFFIFSCSSVQRVKNLDYLPTTLLTEESNPKLNIFTPKEKPETAMPVIIFAHGGNWNRGDKDTYGFYGKDLAKRNIILVVPEYTLSPEVTYDHQAKQIAACIEWTKDNIAKYGGDPNQIYMNGHSAGGHLAALSVMNPKYGVDQSSISGIILIDAAGLDMYWLNTEVPPKKGGFYDYQSTFTNDPETWKDASPIYFISEENPPFLIFQGTKTIEAIAKTNIDFKEKLIKVQPELQYITQNKGHFGMMLQFIWGGRETMDTIEQFIEQHK
ncbi:MAG: alpha/beta hydrolase [Patiriisocius sp.]|uniref:alpha/beta hydrolase n=1 Tax=Patiriisocius sp. TaxID=2822396 RepID=UPI003EF5A039